MRFTFSFVGLASILLISCQKDEVVPELPVEKTVTYTVYAEKDYSGSFYNNAKGQLELTIAKITGNGTTQVLWDTVFAWRNLVDYPAFQNRVILQKKFSILDSKEKLQVSYIRKYDQNGALSLTGTGEPVANGNTSFSYDVPM
ncbi:MAG TPA: hypothetical protein VFQ73_01615 [Flavisolibacter sp.]|nr:hypothetical protein [Flavisolibacter sp.]